MAKGGLNTGPTKNFMEKFLASPAASKFKGVASKKDSNIKGKKKESTFVKNMKKGNA